MRFPSDSCIRISGLDQTEGGSNAEPVSPGASAGFDRRLTVRVPRRDAGLLAPLDEARRYSDRFARTVWHGIIGLIRQSVYGRLAGYEDVNDADRLGRDPAMRWIVVAGLSSAAAHRPARWAGSRRSYSPPMTTSPRSLTFWASIDQVTSASRRRLSCSTWTAPSARPTVTRRARPTTVTSAARAITRCSCSTSSASGALRPASGQRAQRP